jgi:hypothetical protein
MAIERKAPMINPTLKPMKQITASITRITATTSRTVGRYVRRLTGQPFAGQLLGVLIVTKEM